MQDETTFAQQLAGLLAANSEMLTGFTIVYSWIDEDGTNHEAWDTMEDQLLSTTLGQLEMARMQARQSFTLVPDDDDEDEL